MGTGIDRVRLAGLPDDLRTGIAETSMRELDQLALIATASIEFDNVNPTGE